MLIPVGLMFSYSDIEHVVARLRQHTEIWHTVKPNDSEPGF